MSRSNPNMRRTLKLTLKNAQRVGYELQKKNPELPSDELDTTRNKIVRDALAPYGFAATFNSLNWVLQRMPFAKSRHFRRMGRAAVKKDMLVPLHAIAQASTRNSDLRELTFLQKTESMPVTFEW